MNPISHVPFFSRPSGTLGGGHHPRYPPINRWAIIDTPSGRKSLNLMPLAFSTTRLSLALFF